MAREHIQEQINALTVQAKAIMDTVQKQGRKPTLSETREMERLADRIHDFKGYLRDLDRKAGEDELTAKIKEFGDRIGLGDDATGFTTRPGVVAPAVGAKAGDHRWSQAVTRHLEPRGGTKSLVGSGSVAVPVAFNPVPVRDGERPTLVRQLIPTERLDGTDRFSFMRQTVRENNAAPVARGALKPTSRYTVERVEDRVRTVAHLSEPIDRVDLADSNALAAFLDAELRLGVLLAEEAEIVAGDGSGERPTGILNTPGLTVQPYATDILTTTRKAVTSQQALSSDPSAWVLNPADWERLELLREGGDNGAFLLGNGPIDRAQQRLWGLPVAVTESIPTGTGLLGDFAGSARVYVREDVVVTWSENLWRPNALGTGQGANTYETNQLVWRAESRIGLGVLRPSAFTEVDLTA